VVHLGVDDVQLEASVQLRDLMARRAGLHLRARWSDWDKSAFTAASRSHVSVDARSAGP
jgi:hypothetical protein